MFELQQPSLIGLQGGFYMDQDINYAMSDLQEQFGGNTETQDKPASAEHVEQPVSNTTTQTQQVTEPIQQNTTPTPQGYDIDGLGNVTAEQIKEWKQGYMRQSDYTRKTQELARQRKELENQQQPVQQPYGNIPQIQPYAQQFPNQNQYVYPNTQFNPQFNQVMARVDQMEQEFADRQLVQEVERLKNTYPDFDEVAVLNEALARNITDIEFVYKAMRNQDVSRETIKQEILAELAKTKQSTSTIVSSEQNQQPQPVELSNAEMQVAQAMGMTPEEYIKWK